jgi:hypothetical protein
VKTRAAIAGEAPLTYRPFAGLAPIRNRVCASKTAHASKAEAQEHLDALVRDGDNAPERLRPYRCSFCRLWHVGHYQPLTARLRQ